MPLPTTVSVKQYARSTLLQSLRSKRWPQTLSPFPPSPPSISPSIHHTPPLYSDSIYSPFTRLPPEVWVEIFSHCPADFPRIDSQVPPLTLALVCARWYYWATTTPRLWSCFEIVLEGKGCLWSEKEDMKRKLRLWLRRSQQHPLSFRIVHNYDGSNPDLRSAELLTVLLPHTSRWQNIQFHCPSGALAHLPTELSKGSLSALNSLSIRLGKTWNSTFDVSLLEIPWSQLTGLDLQLCQQNIHSLDECFRILSAARNLICCTLNASCVFTLSGDSKKLALPSLRTLKLIMEGDDSAASPEASLLDFLERLQVADLRAFSLEWLVNRSHDGAGLHWRTVHSRFIAFIHSSANSLESLGLAYVPLRDDEIISCLDGLSRLRTLDLRFTLANHQPDAVTDDLLLFLTPAVSLPALQRVLGKVPSIDRFPALSALKLQCSGDYLDHVMLLALVEGRATGQLKTFELMTRKLMSKDFRERMAWWRERGSNFSVSTLNVR